jgi:hypothetical protein
MMGDRRARTAAVPGGEIEPGHQFLGHRPARERPGDVTVRTWAGEPRIDIRLRTLPERTAAVGEPAKERCAADQLRLRAGEFPVVQRRGLALAAVAAQHDPVRERSQHRLVIAAREVLLDPFLHPRERRITRRQRTGSDE